MSVAADSRSRTGLEARRTAKRVTNNAITPHGRFFDLSMVHLGQVIEHVVQLLLLVGSQSACRGIVDV